MVGSLLRISETFSVILFSTADSLYCSWRSLYLNRKSCCRSVCFPNISNLFPFFARHKRKFKNAVGLFRKPPPVLFLSHEEVERLQSTASLKQPSRLLPGWTHTFIYDILFQVLKEIWGEMNQADVVFGHLREQPLSVTLKFLSSNQPLKVFELDYIYFQNISGYVLYLSLEPLIVFSTINKSTSYTTIIHYHYNHVHFSWMRVHHLNNCLFVRSVLFDVLFIYHSTKRVPSPCEIHETVVYPAY